MLPPEHDPRDVHADVAVLTSGAFADEAIGDVVPAAKLAGAADPVGFGAARIVGVEVDEQAKVRALGAGGCRLPSGERVGEVGDADDVGLLAWGAGVDWRGGCWVR
jgi:hypothetical protein